MTDPEDEMAHYVQGIDVGDDDGEEDDDEDEDKDAEQFPDLDEDDD